MRIVYVPYASILVPNLYPTLINEFCWNLLRRCLYQSTLGQIVVSLFVLTKMYLCEPTLRQGVVPLFVLATSNNKQGLFTALNSSLVTYGHLSSVDNAVRPCMLLSWSALLSLWRNPWTLHGIQQYVTSKIALACAITSCCSFDRYIQTLPWFWPGRVRR